MKHEIQVLRLRELKVQKHGFGDVCSQCSKNEESHMVTLEVVMTLNPSHLIDCFVSFWLSPFVLRERAEREDAAHSNTFLLMQQFHCVASNCAFNTSVCRKCRFFILCDKPTRPHTHAFRVYDLDTPLHHTRVSMITPRLRT